jgi:hypothetical protein
MMRGRSLISAMAVLLLAPLSLAAQVGGQGRAMGQGGPLGGLMMARALVEQGSVEFLVSKAAELQLTAEQTQALQAIGTAWAEETKAPREQIRAVLPQGGAMAGGAGAAGDRQALMQRLQEIAPVAQKLQEDDQTALAEALKALDETQQATAKKLLEERQESMRPRRGGF